MPRTVLQSTIYQIRARVDPSRSLNIGASTRQKVDYELRIGFSDEYLNWMYNPPDRDGGYTVGDVINFLENKGVDVLYPIRRRKNAVAKFVQRQILETVEWHKIYARVDGRRQLIGREFRNWSSRKRLVFEKRVTKLKEVIINGVKRKIPVEHYEQDRTHTYEVPTISASSVYRILDKLGRDMVEQIKDELVGSVAPHLAESTIKRREYKQKAHPEYYEYLAGIDQGLIETGQLMQSITYEIIDHTATGKELTYENTDGVSRLRHVASGKHLGRPKGSFDTRNRIRAEEIEKKTATGTVVRGNYKGHIEWGDLKKMSLVSFLSKYPGTYIKSIRKKERTIQSRAILKRKATEIEMEQFKREMARKQLVIAMNTILNEREQAEAEQISAFKAFAIRAWSHRWPKETNVVHKALYSNHRYFLERIRNPDTPKYMRHAYEEFFTEQGLSV